MNAEFNWWLLIVGLGIGAGLAWLVLADMGRRRDAAADRERAEEIAWIASMPGQDGRPLDADVVGRVIELHERWLEGRDPATDEAGPGRAAPDEPEPSPEHEPEADGDDDPAIPG